MRKLALLGSTGSIGIQTLDVVRGLCRGGDFPVSIQVLAARSSVKQLEEQIREFRPQAAAVFDEKAAKDLRDRTRDLDLEILPGMEGLCQAAAWDSADMTLNAVVGMVGLRPTLSAIAAGKTVALANKETLVAGGSIVMEAARQNKVEILPVDSEHSAIFQCLQGCPEKKAVKRLLLTASGGPFFGKTRKELEGVTPAQALRHPNWNMGAKVTIDSATLMNKGLEVTEAAWLFGLGPQDIQVVVHRESIVHSLVEYVDHSVIGQLGTPDMRLPIQYAITYPKRYPSPCGELDLAALGSLTFAQPDLETFRCLKVCLQALERGGLAPAAANGANEEAVALFLQEKIGFLEIPQLVEAAMLRQPDAPADSVEAVLQADREARQFVLENA
ncbi:MAG TPA: 1-deoxy-D-xylulose-5-phosphate reductoisomerase [Candidatus Acutalibacter pullistercoris]|uniref:1-deoxy-D-xylulose 5-phosphate reductoisomerase n=1 Tax=Candidatus Acutalibacter pullistercoris TaxID=2838418 RepID=A0A9D1YBK7_9FIRM|nr:1-deoxy-D-xylulose-5-phosphate reductoisomerase [Candidatus Acutalibacter pullistercoris]